MEARESSVISKGGLAKREDPWYQAQAILSRRDHSVYEMKFKLGRKGFSSTEIAKVVSRLLEQGWLNDEKFALALAESTVLLKAVGPRALKQRLREKRIAQVICEDVVARIYAEGREIELAREAAQGWLKQKKGMAIADQKKAARLRSFLWSRGFTGGIVVEVVADFK